MSRRVLIIDNYDSFVFNIAQLLKRLQCDFDIAKNDGIDFEKVYGYTHIIISPGPGIPGEAGDVFKLIDAVKDRAALLGVCLGHQAVGEFFGASLKKIEPRHGFVSRLIPANGGDVIFDGVSDFRIGRYHSWAVNEPPDSLVVTGTSECGEIMSMRHRFYNIRTVQFHPESIMTPCGLLMLENWLSKC